MVLFIVLYKVVPTFVSVAEWDLEKRNQTKAIEKFFPAVLFIMWVTFQHVDETVAYNNKSCWVVLTFNFVLAFL